jgi:hypothetical protein
MFDFFRGHITINYNKLPSFAGSQQQSEAGWDEDYFFPVSPGIDQTRINFRNLVAARAALLPLGCYIFRTGFNQASLFRSSYSLNGNAINPVLTSEEGASGNIGTTNDIEAGALYRFENGAGRRWQRLITALRDDWVGGMALFPGSFSYDPVSGMPAPQLATTGGVQATATATVSGGAVNSVSITANGSGYLVAPNMFFRGGGGSGVTTTTLTGGTVTSAGSLAGLTGFSGTPTVYIPPPQDEPFGLMAGQAPSTYIANFLSCVANYCINFVSVRTPNAAFPSGYMTQGDTNPSGGTAGYTATRVLYQRISDHDRGRIRTTNKGRRKRVI